MCWGGRAPQCWCQIWAPVPFPVREGGARCGAKQQHAPAAAHSHVRRPWRKVHSHVTNFSSQTVEPDISSGMSRGNTHPKNWAVHKWKSIDLASARDFLNSRFAETDAICKVCPGVIQTGPWLLNTICSSRTVVFNIFQPGKPLYTFSVEVRSRAAYLKVLTVSLLSSVNSPEYQSSQIHRNWQPLL